MGIAVVAAIAGTPPWSQLAAVEVMTTTSTATRQDPSATTMRQEESNNSNNLESIQERYERRRRRRIIEVYRLRHSNRLGHSFCGFCCDMRQAVIICNTISLIYTSWFMALYKLTINTNFMLLPEPLMEYHTTNTNMFFLLFWIIIIVAIIMYTICGIYGAIHYNKILVSITTIWYSLLLVLLVLWFLVVTTIIAPTSSSSTSLDEGNDEDISINDDDYGNSNSIIRHMH